VSERRVFALDDEEAALVGNVLPPARPEAARLEAIFQRLVVRPPPAGRAWRVRVAVVGAVLLVSGASVASYRMFQARGLSSPAVLPAAVRPPERFVRAPVVAPPTPFPPEAAPAAVPASRSRARNQIRPRSDLEREAAYLAVPMAKIRRGGDPTSALAQIDHYLQRFPRGALRPEAKLLRVDALLLLRRSGAALAALDEMDLDDNRRGLELRLVRGELRAQTDCRAALPDFDAVLRARPSADLDERARRDRADCLRRLQTAP
jgi:hypothetical protein